ncbi:putative replication factor A2 [Blattamonas nauphoetae]|uniref:Replication factor A2 n=1 Tax=Blattamonas nauphoetae TaxID=2049346 RepID=A0ABQ9XXI9_9EUKA|nr:putative replication factor A2 [Blattamonas nauphoetae]
MGSILDTTMAYPSSPSRTGGAYSGEGEGDEGARRLASSVSTFVPMSVKLVHSTSKEYVGQPFAINGVELNTVELIGLLLETTVSGNQILYKLDDGTSCIDVRQYITATGEEQRVNTVQTGTYARVVGNIKQQGESREINAFQVTKIEDFNQITYHILATINAHIQRTGPISQASRSDNTSSFTRMTE